jgi:hypothetical protein
MPATLTRPSTTAAKLRAGLLIRKQIDQLERRFETILATVPKYMLTRNHYGFSAREMKKIAHKLHAKAKEAVTSGRGKEFRGSIEEAL